MRKLSLTTFVDIVAASGTSKATKAIRALKDDEYHPAKDFYKQLRERIIDLHQNDKDKKYLRRLMFQVTDRKKINHYSTLIDQYSKWIGNKKMKWFNPPQGEYGTKDLIIRVNPELGLKIKGKDYVIKLYFKSDSLSKNKADIILGILEGTLNSHEIMAVLDIRKGKLFVPTIKIPMLKETVDAEMAYISAFS